MPQLFLWLCLFLLVQPAPAGAAATVQATVDRTRIGANDSLRFTVTINGGDGAVEVSAIKDFQVRSEATSSSIEISNGQMNRRVIHSYVLLPKRTGALEIPALTVMIDGSAQQTKPIRVEVGGQLAGGDQTEAEVLLEAEVSNEQPYQGQQLIYTLRLLQRTQLVNAQLERPQLDRFAAVEVKDGRQPQRVDRAGISYQAAEFRYLLTPIAAGRIEIGPALVQCEVEEPGRGNRRAPASPFFGGPLFGATRLVPRTYRSNPLVVTVKPLPETAGPDPFSGLIGRFTLIAAVDKDHLEIGDSSTLSITIEGSGNLQDSRPPEVAAADAIRLYPESPVDELRVDARGTSGRRIFRYALVAVKAGTFQLAPVTINVFDPDRGAYLTISTDPMEITVVDTAGGSAAQDAAAGLESQPPMPLEKEEVAVTGQDILPLKEDLAAIVDQRPLSLFPFTLLLLLPALLYGLLRGILKLRAHGQSDAEIMRSRSRLALKAACRPDDAPEEFLNGLYRAVVSAIGARTGNHTEALTHAEVEAIIRQTGGRPEFADAVLELLRRIEAHRYGAGTLDPNTRRELLKVTQEVTKDLLK